MLREMCGLRPFSRAIRSIASGDRTAARTGFRSRRKKRFILKMTILTLRVSRGYTRQYRRSARTGKPCEPFPVRIDVDHAVQRHGLGGGDRVGEFDEVAVQIGDAAGVAAALAFLARRVEVWS